jgi:hypothetical protein
MVFCYKDRFLTCSIHGKCVLDRRQSPLFAMHVLRSPVCLYPQVVFYSRQDASSRSYAYSFKALTISTHTRLTALTKHAPFASDFPLLRWKQVMRLMRILIQVFPSTPSPAFIGSDFLATTGQSAISQPIASAFPFRLYLSYLVHACGKETTRLPSVICIFYSIHPDPNHVDEPYRSCPFPVFL